WRKSPSFPSSIFPEACLPDRGKRLYICPLLSELLVFQRAQRESQEALFPVWGTLQLFCGLLFLISPLILCLDRMEVLEESWEKIRRSSFGVNIGYPSPPLVAAAKLC